MKPLFDFLQQVTYIFLSIFLLGTYLLGFVLAKGFWSTFFCWFPFYSWYIVIEHFVIKYNLI